ncbi:helix-turn-helix domain-containing protein [Halovivax gelatinilyticus]|uniref:helix-turn-helix domain-containing protein n=1 Tax=Halovivax gelatinilyticus TaxID=2961597 RepID=UPI0020CA416F|nr:helix-turn-helix domain-containing protein [Halovivax gelatinilyticus]
MKTLRIAIDLDDERVPPEMNLASASPAVDRQLILGGSVLDGIESTISYVDGDPDAVEAILSESAVIETYEITGSNDGCFLYCRQELGASGTHLFDAFFEDTIVVVPPFECRADGTVRLTVVGAPDEVQRVFDAAPDDFSIDVIRIGDSVGGPVNELSVRQREAIDVAWEMGYYEVPRENGIEAVASELDCAVSTTSDLLRRAESRLVGNALDAPR